MAVAQIAKTLLFNFIVGECNFATMSAFNGLVLEIKVWQFTKIKECPNSPIHIFILICLMDVGFVIFHFCIQSWTPILRSPLGVHDSVEKHHLNC